MISGWDHPRACGEHAVVGKKPSTIAGSSPRLRGTPSIVARQPPYFRIIPALAGNTTERAWDIVGQWDHPRACGEHWIVDARGAVHAGSSPRLRGTLQRFH